MVITNTGSLGFIKVGAFSSCGTLKYSNFLFSTQNTMNSTCEICGRRVEDHYSTCPIASRCPMVYKGRCSVYGYCLNVLGDPRYRKNYLTYCVQFSWRISREVEVNEFKFAKNKRRRREAIIKTQEFYSNRSKIPMEILR